MLLGLRSSHRVHEGMPVICQNGLKMFEKSSVGQIQSIVCSLLGSFVFYFQVKWPMAHNCRLVLLMHISSKSTKVSLEELFQS